KRKYPPKKGPSGRKPGGQKGHKPARRELVPEEELAGLEILRPESCEGCGHVFDGTEPTVGEPLRHQVTELPPVRAEVVEHRQVRVECPCCGVQTLAPLPPGVPRTCFGPRLQAIVAWLIGVFGLSRRELVRLAADLLGTKLSVATVQECCERTSEGLRAPVEEAEQEVRRAGIAYADETGWKQAGKRMWLWIVVTARATVFRVADSRGAKIIQEMLGADFAGVVVSDRWSAYTKLAKAIRQVCWAHLKRDFAWLAELGGQAKALGEWALRETKLLFELWHERRGGTLSAHDFAASLPPLKARFKRLLLKGEQTLEPKRGKGMCRDLLKHWKSFWTFTGREDVEPTNNDSERGVRKGVLWRRKSQGTRSEAGSRFVERILTVAATCRQHDRPILAYLTEVCEATLHGRPPPSLLPPATQ
ncbi:MAG: IS66 family transposase, partial [Deltaproteobacteria bacterium]|nr:IS66 family transposase [Deltaproteobacteria bacterium]